MQIKVNSAQDKIEPASAISQTPIVPAAEEKPLPVSQSKFISLAEAAKLTGYHQDYLGQLARAGKLNAQKIGRNWATTLEAVKLLDPQIVVPESHAEKIIEEPKIETNVET